MSGEQFIPSDPLGFIQDCVYRGRVFWTYHVNMRIKERSISRETILGSVNHYEIIESYPKDKYMPSYLVYTEYENSIFHILFAVDVEKKNVRIVTSYRPDPAEWSDDFKRRKNP
jgi:hypothetical protein